MLFENAISFCQLFLRSDRHNYFGSLTQCHLPILMLSGGDEESAVQAAIGYKYPFLGNFYDVLYGLKLFYSSLVTQ